MPDFDLSKPVKTRDGRPARIIATDRRCNGLRPVIALVTMEYDIEEIHSYADDGTWSSTPSDKDLVNVPEEKTVWVNVYNDGSTHHHETLFKANNAKGKYRIGVLRLVYADHNVLSCEVLTDV